MTSPDDHRADNALRADIRALLVQCLEAVDTARRWQLVAVSLSLHMIAKVLGEPTPPPRQARNPVQNS